MLYYTSTSNFPEPSGGENRNPSRKYDSSGRQFLRNSGNEEAWRAVKKWPGFLMLALFMLGSHFASAQCITDYDPSSLVKTDCVDEFTFLKVDFTPQPSNPTITWEYSPNAGGTWLPVSSSPISHNINNNFAEASTRLNLLSPDVMMDGYLFRVQFSGSCVETSSVFTLDLNGPIVIVDHPSSQTICETASDASFDVSASAGGAGGTVEYRWQYWNGSSWSFMPNSVTGWNTDEVTISNTDSFWPAAGSGVQVRCRIRIPTCAVQYTNSATLNLDINPTVDAGPATATICQDALLNLNGTVNGVVFSQTWSGGGGGIDSPSSLNTFFDPSMSSNSGTFPITLTTNANGACPAASDIIMVTVDELDIDDHDPGNTNNAGDRVICEMDDTFFNVDFSSTEPYSSISWEFSTGGSPWAPIADLTSGATYSVSNSAGQSRLDLMTVDNTLDGSLFRVTIIAGTCTVTSEVFELYVNGPASITMHPENVIDLCASTADTTFTVAATTGSGTINYRWQYNNGGGWTNVPNTVAGFNLTTLTVTNADFPVWPNPGSSVDIRCRINQESCSNIFTEPATFSVSPDLPAIADAGPDAHICEGDNYTVATGTPSVSGPGISTGTWSTSGDGFFDDPNDFLGATYFPGPGDVAAGMVTLSLMTNDPVGVCPPTTDDILVTIHPATVVDAGMDQSACSDDSPTFQLNGSVSGTVTGGTWSTSGSGTFNPDATTLNAVYEPSMADYGTVVSLILTSDTPPAFTTCPAEMDTVDITIDYLEITSHSPASLSRIECEGDNSNFRVNYTSSPTNPATVTWQVDGGAGFMDITFPDPLYSLTTPGGNTQLNLTNVPMGIDGYTYRAVFVAGTCTDTSDVFTLQVNESAWADAGDDQTICGGENVSLSGTIGGVATSGTWTTSGMGSFVPNETTLNATYIPHPDDYGTVVTLTLTTDNPAGPCPAGVDMMDVSIDAVIVDSEIPASLIRNKCQGTNTNFTVQYISKPHDMSIPTATWEYSSNGGSTWNDASGLGNITSPALTGMATHSSRLTLMDLPLSYDNYLFRLRVSLGVCNEVVSLFALYVNPGPTVDAGADFSICAGDDIVLDGMVDGTATTGTWSITPGPGAGSFSGVDLFAADATYTPAVSEHASMLNFVLVTDNPGGACPAVSDTVKVTIDSVAFMVNSPLMNEVCHGELNQMFLMDFRSYPDTLLPTWQYSVDNGSNWLAVVETNPVTTFDIDTIPGVPYATTKLTIDTVTTDMDGYLFRTVFMEGACAPVISDVFSLQVNGPITITSQPVDIIDECQSTDFVVFEAMVDNPGSGTLTYQWQKSSTGTGGWSPVAESPGVTEGTATNALTVFNAGFPLPAPDSIYYRLRIQLAECTPPNVFSDVAKFKVSDDPIPTSSAGGPYSWCEGTPLMPVMGMFGGSATSGSWSTLGDGTFDDPNASMTNYNPGPMDLASATAQGASGHVVKLIFTTNDPANNVCPPAVDTADFTIYPMTIVDAGQDQSLCNDPAPQFQLAGMVSGTVSMGSWSQIDGSMMGTFSPGVTDLDAVFTPHMSDYGSTIQVELLSATPSGMTGCMVARDTVALTIDTLGITGNSNLNPTAFCELTGSTFFRVNYVSNPDPDPADVEWQVDLGGGFEDVTTAMVLVDGMPTAIDYSVNTTGTQTRLDILSAPAELDGAQFRAVLTSGACTETGPIFTLSVNEEVTVDPGMYDPICAGDVIALDGMISGGVTTGTWSAGGGTFTPDAMTLNATYEPTPAEIAAGSVTLTLQSDTPAGPGGCPAASDMVTVNIDSLVINENIPATFVRNVCQGTNTTFRIDYTSKLAGVPAAATVSWEYSDDSGASWYDADVNNGGIGTIGSPAPNGFSTHASRLLVEDIPISYNDYLIRVTLDLGACENVSSMFALYVTPGPTVDAGEDITICAGENVMLDGTVGGSATTGTWSWIGTMPPSMIMPGTISGVDLFNADATYTPSTDEYGKVIYLKLTTDNPGGACPAMMDTIAVQIDLLTIDAYNPASLARTECAGDSEFFQVDYTSSPGMQSPVWESSSNGVDWTPVSGPDYSVDNSTPGETRLNIPVVSNAMNGLMYRAVFSDGNCAPLISNEFTLTVNGPVTITQQPVSITGICESTESVQFMADAMNGGEGTMTYLWQYSMDGISGWTPITEVMGDAEGVSTGTLTLYNTWTMWPGLGGNIYLRMRVSLNACSQVTTDVVELSIAPDVPAMVSAGSDDAICEGETYTLGALLFGSATSGTWSTSGDGTFDNPGFPGATYTPGPGDLGNAQAAGPAGYVVTLTFTSNDPVPNICPADSDDMELTIFPFIDVDAGVDVNVCIDGTQNDPILLNGFVTGAVTGGTWSPGAGILNTGDPQTIYTPTNGHVNNGFRRLILTSDPHMVCPTVRDTMFVYFNDDFGPLDYTPGGGVAGTRTVCNGDDTSFRVIHGTTPVTNVQWQYNAGSGWINVNDVSTPLTGVNLFSVSSPSPGGNFATQLNLEGVTPAVHNYQFRAMLENGECATTSDAFTLFVNGDIGAITVPDDVIVCESVTTQSFMASVAASGNGTLVYQWQYSENSAMGPFLNVPGAGATGETTLNLMLTAASAAYPTVGTTVYLRLQVELEGCTTAYSDPIEFGVESAATVYAGVDQTICEGEIALMASAFYGGAASSVTWTTSGDGSFDDPTEILAIYTPGPMDISSGMVTLTVTTNDPQGAECDPVSDDMILTIDPAATVDAGEDMDICVDNLPIQLDGSFGGAATSASWSGGLGSFSPSPSTLNATYDPHPSEVGTIVSLTLTTNDPGTACGPVSDNVLINIGPGVVINSYVPASMERTICYGGNTTFRVNTDPTFLAVHDWMYSFDGFTWFDNFNDLGFATYIESGFDDYTELELGGGMPNIPGDIMYVRVNILDRGCDLTSSIFTLNINGPTGWDLQPADQTICHDEALASFTATPFNDGAGTFTFQWQYDNGGGWTDVPASVAGYNTNTLFLTPAASFWPGVGGTVDLRLNATIDECGTITTEVVVFEVEQCAFTELTTIFAMDGSSFTQGQSRDGVFLIQNIGNDDTNSPVSFVINVPSETVMTNMIDPMATTANVFGGVAVNNDDWNITPIPIGYLIESKAGVVIPGNGGISVIGINFTAVGAPNSQGVIRGFLQTGTAGDVDPGNNSTSVGFIIN